MRLLSGIAIALSLIPTNLLAQEATVQPAPEKIAGERPLAPGKPAGVEKAQRLDNKVLWVAGLGVVAAGVIMLATQRNSQTATSTTSTQ
jgi:hypothetical protein